MRSLTGAEANVIEALLASVPGDEVERARYSGVPRTTFQTIRRRVLVSGWLYERYVPAPAAVHSPGVSFWLGQPFAERRADVIRLWRNEPRTVVLWASPDTILAVSFDRPSAPGPQSVHSPKDHLIAGDWLRRSWTIRASSDPGSLPIYFDYEGAWTRRIGSDSPISYPQPLPQVRPGATSPSPGDMRALLVHPFEMTPSEGAILRFSSSHLPRRQRHLLDQRWAARRVFPSLTEIPPYHGGHDERVVFVTGLLRGGASLEDLRVNLYQDCRVAPFLGVGDGTRVLLAMLSPAPDGVPPRLRSVLEVFQNTLREIETVREPLDTLFPVVQHRYDRLLSGELDPPRDRIQ